MQVTISVASVRAKSYIALSGTEGVEEEASGKWEGQGCGQDMDVDSTDKKAEKLRAHKGTERRVGNVNKKNYMAAWEKIINEEKGGSGCVGGENRETTMENSIKRESLCFEDCNEQMIYYNESVYLTL